jgi:outer membrane protein assembly factor BamB
MFQTNPQHTGVYQTTPAYRFNAVKFIFKTGGPIRSSAALAQGVLFFGSGDGQLYAVDAATGKERWRFKTGGAVHSSPAVAQGVVYFTSRDGSLYAVDAAKGRQVWKHQMGRDLQYANGFDYYLSSPTIVGMTLFVGGGDGHLYAIDVRTGKVLWSYAAGSRIRGTPAVEGNAVFVGTMDGYLLAVDKNRGSLLWRFATLGSTLKIEDFGYDRSALVSSPSVANGVVTVGCRDGFLYAVDAATGTKKWSNNHEISWVLSTPAVDDGKVYVGSSDAQFFQAVDHATGQEVWRYRGGGPIWSSAAVAGPLLYFGVNDGHIVAVDKKTGVEKWRFKTGDRIFSSPLIENGVVYCGSDDGNLYAIEGSKAPDPAAPSVRRAVFWETRPGFAGRWFSGGTDEWIREYFKREGYEVVDANGLEALMEQELSARAGSVVVFADNRVPQSVVKEESEKSLIRRYLDAGGKIVWLGPDPIAWKRDSLGKFEGINYDRSARILGIRYPGKSLEGIGWYNSVVTEEGKRWGMRGWGVGLGCVDPSQVSTVLAKDEHGMAGAWVKNFGGKEGTGLVQLHIPRDRPTDLYHVKLVAEYGLAK